MKTYRQSIQKHCKYGMKISVQSPSCEKIANIGCKCQFFVWKICQIGSKLSLVKEDQYQFKVIVKLKQSSSGQKKIKISSEIFLQNWKQKPLCGKLHIGSKYCRKDISVRKSEEEDLQWDKQNPDYFEKEIVWSK